MSPTPLKLFIFDRNENDLFLAKHMFLSAAPGISIAGFSGERAAIRWLRAQKSSPHLFLLGTDDRALAGSSAVKQVLPVLLQYRMPVFLITAHITEELLLEVYARGVAGYIPKPLNAALNLKRLQSYFTLLQIPLAVWPYAVLPAEITVVA